MKSDDSDHPIPISTRRSGNHIAALFIADLHITDKAPASRAEKKNWLEVQARPYQELKKLQAELGGPPVLIAGDLFHRWDASAEAINFALENLPDNCWAIPGNHDLPNHVYREIGRTAYCTLDLAGKIKHMIPGAEAQHEIGQLLVSPFPCGFKVGPPRRRHSLGLNVALVHDYAWTEKTGHPHAPEEKRYAKWMKKLANYDVAVFGDNHSGWLIQKEGKCSVLTCGGFIRRRSDEIDYTPSIGILHTSGKITRHYLNVSGDQWTDLGVEIAKIEKGLEIDLSGFVEELVEQKKHGMNWKKTVLLWMMKNKIDKHVQEIIIEVVEGAEREFA